AWNAGSLWATRYAASNSSTFAINVSGAKRPPNSPNHPRSLGPVASNSIVNSSIGSLDFLEKCPQFIGIFHAGRTFHAAGHIYREGPDFVDCLSHVLGRQSPRQNDGSEPVCPL